MNSLGDFLLWMLWAFFLVMAIWIFITIFADIFRRHDISGWGKAGWVLLIFILPVIGCLIYVIARPAITTGDLKAMTQAEAASKAVAGVSTADELTKLAQLQANGSISQAEYDSLKAKLVATPA